MVFILGHGPESTWARKRRSNPYVAEPDPATLLHFDSRQRLFQ